MKYLGPSLHNSPPPAALQTPRSMTPHKHFKDKEDMGTAKGAERENPHGLSFLPGWPGPPTLGSGTHSCPQETRLCQQSHYHRWFGFERLALAERFNKHIAKRCLVKFWIVSVKSWEQPSKKRACTQRNASQRFSPASPSAGACLLLLLNFASLCKQSAMRGICSVHKFPAFLSSSRA